MLAAYGSAGGGGSYAWLWWVIVALVVVAALAVWAWWRAHKRTMSYKVNHARGKMNRAWGKTTGRV